MSYYPVRAGVFVSSEQALQLLEDLHSAGFDWDQISVICSDKKKVELFPKQTRRSSSAMLDQSALNVAATGVLGLGGAAVTAALISGPGMAILVLGAFAGIAAAGTFTTLMATRGFESEACDFYEQAVQEGMILVAVEISDSCPDVEAKRLLVSEMIAHAGGDVVVLAH